MHQSFSVSLSLARLAQSARYVRVKKEEEEEEEDEDEVLANVMTGERGVTMAIYARSSVEYFNHVQGENSLCVCVHSAFLPTQ